MVRKQHEWQASKQALGTNDLEDKQTMSWGLQAQYRVTGKYVNWAPLLPCSQPFKLNSRQALEVGWSADV